MKPFCWVCEAVELKLCPKLGAAPVPNGLPLVCVEGAGADTPNWKGAGDAEPFSDCCCGCPNAKLKLLVENAFAAGWLCC